MNPYSVTPVLNTHPQIVRDFPLTLEDFLNANMAVPSHLRTLEHLKPLVARLELSESFWRQFVLFHPDRYQWKMIVRNDDVEIALICWLPGQKSGVHPHKNAALNVTKVLQGSITQQYYRPDHQRQLVLEQEVTVSDGEITWTDRYEYHQLVNNAEQNCITLHVYTPVRE